MMRQLVGMLLCVMLGVAPTVAQDGIGPPDEKKGPTDVIQWRIAPETVHSNIHFIIDRSGSMNADQIASAMGSFLYIAEQNLDEVNIAITVFGKDAVRWEGIPNERTPKGWAALPSADNLKIAKEWLKTVAIDSGSTKVEEAIATLDASVVTRTGGDINDITVIIISDLCFDQFPSAINGAVAAKQQAREQNGARPLSFGFIGIKTTDQKVNEIQLLCEQPGSCQGSWLAFIEKTPEPKEEDEPPAAHGPPLPPQFQDPCPNPRPAMRDPNH